MIILYGILIFLLSFYSYALIDPNITFFQNGAWIWFREVMVNLGYYHRDISSLFYVILLVLLFIFHFYFVSRYKNIKMIPLLIVISVFSLISYPLLSHDFFNYMFDAKILTFYHQNPYIHKALDFPTDPWLRFMHWTHRPYPYGPVFLIISLVPAFLGFGKFLPHYLLLKAIFVLFYILSVYFLSKINKKWAVLFATHPLVLIEGLISSHNDLISVSIGIIGIYYLTKNKNIWARILFLLSGGIKYITLPLVILSRSNKKIQYLSLVIILFLIAYLSIKVEIQPWYFLAALCFLPFIEIIQDFWLFSFGLLLSYFPFIAYGNWTKEEVDEKHWIILIFFIANIGYVLYKKVKKKSITHV